ncbi:MAG: hypothetical protein HZA14_10735 [Nitrospirae bacterium]|nr:hypothetical protein [Nitrospirota bacterium]
MKLSRIIALVCCMVFLFAFRVSADEILTNETVVTLVKSGLGEALIISKIKASQSKFDVSTEELLKLKAEGVSDGVLQAMIDSTSLKNSQQGAKAPDPQDEADYQNALDLIGAEKYEEAITLLTELAGKSNDFKYHYALIDAVLEKCRVMKEQNNSEWKTRMIEAQSRIKGVSRANRNNPDFWLLFVKFSGLREDERDVDSGLKKALAIKPDYIKAYILKGDVYSRLAKAAQDESIFDAVENKRMNVVNVREARGETSRAAYKHALESGNLSNEEKAAVLYNMGELELQIFGNKTKAEDFWNQSVSANPESKGAALSKERLNASNK